MPALKRLALPSVACVVALSVAAAHAAEHKPFKPKLDPPTPDQFRTVDPENVLVIDTTKGRVLVEMAPEIAPKSVARIKELAREHFYDGLTFHRVVDNFMAQGGDPKGDGTGGSSKPDVPAEFTFRRGSDAPYARTSTGAGVEEGFVNTVPVRGQISGLMVMTADGKVQDWGEWCPGVAGMARASSPDSANSQFFLMRQSNAVLEHNYTVWGRVISGEDVVRSLKTGEPVPDPDKMTQVRVLSDLPADSRPKVQVLDTNSAYFKEQAKYVEDVCDIQFPAKVN